MMDWLGKMLNLPEQFLFSGQNSCGGGVIQGTASEATLVALLSARARILDKQKLTSSGNGVVQTLCNKKEGKAFELMLFAG